MSASREWTEYHLTPRGWETGTTSIDGNRRERAKPTDRLRTCTYQEEQSSVYSSVHKTTQINWSLDDTDEIARLKKQFGECPMEIVF